MDRQDLSRKLSQIHHIGIAQGYILSSIPSEPYMKSVADDLYATVNKLSDTSGDISIEIFEHYEGKKSE